MRNESFQEDCLFLTTFKLPQEVENKIDETVPKEVSMGITKETAFEFCQIMLDNFKNIVYYNADYLVELIEPKELVNVYTKSLSDEDLNYED